MSLREWFAPKRAVPPPIAPVQPEAPPSPRLALVCPSCTHEDFALGGLTFGFDFDGEQVVRRETGAQLCCNHCGKRIAVNREGAYEPADDALPGLWAVAAKQERERMRQANGGAPVPPRPPMRAAGLRRGAPWAKDERGAE